MSQNQAMNRLCGSRIPALVAATMAVLALAACGDKEEPKATCPVPKGVVSAGELLPANCSLEDFDGGRFDIDGLRGKPAVINFWATWCTFCIDEMPALQRVYASLNGRVSFVGADLVGIMGEVRSAAREFAARTKVKYRLVFDGHGVFYGYFGAPERPTLPVTIFVKADSRVAFRQYGPLTEAKLRRLLRDKLGVT
jgi:thiol-disulfide isomerase/thioredoxin